MCFTSGPTSDDRGSSPSLTDGLRAKLLQISGSKRQNSKKAKVPASRLSKAYARVKSPQAVAKVVALTKKASSSPSRTDFKSSSSRSPFTRLGSSTDTEVMQKAEAMTNSLSPKGGVGSQRFTASNDSENVIPKDVRSLSRGNSKGFRSQRFGPAVSNSSVTASNDSENVTPKDVRSLTRGNSKGLRSQRFGPAVSNSSVEAKDVASPKDQVRSEQLIKSSNSEIVPKDVRLGQSKVESLNPKDAQSEPGLRSDPVSKAKVDKKAFIPAQLISKMNTKQMKGMMKGVGKELRRAASTVGEKLPNYQNKKKSKEERERLELLEAEAQKPQVRNADEIKKAYGHPSAADNANQAAMITRDKLHERGEKISAVQRRTTELEADAANFQSLAQELVKKMEAKKWYEFS
ncbi:unnamed protein product [Calypogeia fissa]